MKSQVSILIVKPPKRWVNRNAGSRSPYVWFAGISLVGALVGLLSMILLLWLGTYTRARGDSPDGTKLVKLQYLSGNIDRNFTVRYVDREAGRRKTLFRSADQKHDYTVERVVWSPDSRYVAVTGDEFFVIDGARLPNGELLFLLYDTQDEMLYCNTSLREGYTPMNGFQAAQLLGPEAR